MRTPEMSDEELDALFRRGAEAYPDEVHLGAWSRMEDKLQQAALNRLRRRQIAKLFAVELVLVGLALLLVGPISWRHRPVEASANKKQSSVAQVSKLQVSPAIKSNAAATGRNSAKPIARPSLAASTVTAAATRPIAEVPAIKPTAAATVPGMPAATAFPPARKQQAQKSVRSRLAGHIAPKRHRLSVAAQVRAADYGVHPARLATGGKPSARKQNEPSSPGELPTVQPAGVRRELALPTATISFPAPPAVLVEPGQDTIKQKAVALEPAADSTRTEERVRPAYRLLISVLGAPSLSAVRTLQTAQLGGDLGLSLEYRLTSRLRMRASLIRSVKRYGAASADYTAPNSWGWRPGQYVVNGNCRITVLPVDLRYDVISRPTYALFASLGMNSLLMRNERYQYDYQVNGQTRTATARVENGANYPFSVLALSAGVERPLSARCLLQAEPFVQLPLGRIGAGQVRLSSVGLQFSLKYGLLPTRRPQVP